MEEKKIEEVYSYHTFMFPFLWKNRQHNTSEQIDKFLEFLNKEKGYWKPQKCPLFVSDFSDIEKDLTPDKYEKLYQEAKFNYAVYQYYNDPARKAIFGHAASEHSVGEVSKEDVQNFVFDCQAMAQKNNADITYRIMPDKKTCLSEEEQETGYILDINNITLRLYPVGIAILVYELENRRHRSLKAVKAINDYGRRVQLASMSYEVITKRKEEDKLQFEVESLFKLTADTISVCGIQEDFKTKVKGYDKNKQDNKRNPWAAELDYMSNTVVGLFFDKDGNSAVSLDKNDKKKLYLEPYVDDRMFVLSLVSDETIIPYGKVQYEDVSSLEVSYVTLKDLYELAFIDPPGDLCCQNRKKLREDLEDCVYTRWIEYGTLHMITQYSMVCITGSHENVESSVINPFLTIYKELVQLVLVQRASIIMFAEIAANISQEARKEKVKNIPEKIFNLQKEYVSFQNQLLLFEVTAQLQGIELYQMLQKKMEISSQEQEMEKQLQNLFEISQTETSEKTNNILNIMTIFGLLFTGVQVIQQQLCESPLSERNFNVPFWIMGAFLIGASMYYHRRLNGNNKKTKGEKVIWGMVILLLIVLIACVVSDFWLWWCAY